MPTTPTPPPSSQGSSVSFEGTALGRLTQWKFEPGTATFQDCTSQESYVVGTGDEARVVKDYTCTAIEPGTVEVSLFGCPPYVRNDCGKKGTLAVTFEGGGLSEVAYLERFDVTGNVGAFLVGTARFRVTG